MTDCLRTDKGAPSDKRNSRTIIQILAELALLNPLRWWCLTTEKNVILYNGSALGPKTL